MTYRVVVAPVARAESVEAFRWIAGRSPAAARRWYAGLERTLDALKRGPEGRPIAIEESERLGRTVRQVLYGRRRSVYRILYAVEGDIVFVLHIRHGARGPIEP